MWGWKTFAESGNYWISTSNIELSNNLAGFPADIIDYKYETMVFPLAHGEIQYGDEVECLRTSDEDEAYLNHLMMFEKYNNL